MHELEIIGYSERGVLNSLFYEIKSLPNNLEIINKFLDLISFPYLTNSNFDIKSANVLIEQSFSDFGTSDAVLTINNNEINQTVFIEAKVKTYQRQSWLIDDEFEDFKSLIKQEESSSNLFMQLYLKSRLIGELENSGINSLQKGVPFPKCSSKAIRKIGENGVVLRAIEILQQYCGKVFFVSLVPDDISELKNFYHNILKNYYPIGFQEWDVTNWGYISWAKVEDFCIKNDLKETQKVFKFNQGQIY